MQAAIQRFRDYRKAVSPLVAFDIPNDPTPYLRKKVARYYKYLFGSEHGPGITQGVKARVARRDPVRLRKLQEELGQGELRGIKYAWAPSALDPKTKRAMPVTVVSRKRAPDKVVTQNVTHLAMKFNKKNLANNPAQEVSRVMAELKSFLPPIKGIVYGFQVNNGPWLYGSLTLEQTTLNTVLDLMNRYQAGSIRVQRDSTRYWGNWLDGLTLEYATNQRTLAQVFNARLEQSTARRKVRKLNISQVHVMEAVRDIGGGATEPIAYRYSGAVDDPGTRRILSELHKSGLLLGDQNRWTMSAKGRKWLADATETLKTYDRLTQ